MLSLAMDEAVLSQDWEEFRLLGSERAALLADLEAACIGPEFETQLLAVKQIDDRMLCHLSAQRHGIAESLNKFARFRRSFAVFGH